MIKNNCYYYLLIAIVMASLECFSPTFIGASNFFFKLILYSLAVFFCILVSKSKSILDKKLLIAVIVFSFCQLMSAYNAYVFNGQEIVTSLIATMQGFGYILLIPLSKSKLTICQIEKLAKFFTICYLICSVLNRLSPYPLFGSADEGSDRGATRFRLLGIYWVIFFFLMKINRYAVENKKNDLYWIIASGMGILFSLTRQDIVVSFILGGMLYFVKTKIVKKLAFAIFTIVLINVVAPHIPVVNSLIEKSIEEKQAQSQYDNIRIVAAEFYTFEYPRNLQQSLFGVGVPSFGNSNYGNQMVKIQEVLKVFREDVGYCGFYFNYGLIATVIMIGLFLWVLYLKLPRQYIYLKYYSAAFLLLNIASSPCQSNVSILPFICALYVVIRLRYELKYKNDKRKNIVHGIK